MIIVIRGNENQFGYLDCEPVNLSDDTQWSSGNKKKKIPKTNDTEEFLLSYFCYQTTQKIKFFLKKI